MRGSGSSSSQASLVSIFWSASPAGRQTAPQPFKGYLCVQRKVFIRGTVPPCEEPICSLHGGLMRQPAKVLFLCAEMIYGTHGHPLRLRTVDS